MVNLFKQGAVVKLFLTGNLSKVAFTSIPSCPDLASVSPGSIGGAVVVDQPAREADQDRREGCRLRMLRHVPMVEVAVWRQMFADILSLITRLRAPRAPA